MIKPGKQRTAVELIRGLREMHGLARAGLVMTVRDLSILDEAADWIEAADERIAIMAESMEMAEKQIRRLTDEALLDEDGPAVSGLISED